MSFDTQTRNRLAKFVATCRKLLCGDFNAPGGEIARLLAHYGIQVAGECAELDKLPHLDERGRETARTLRAILAHKRANAPTEKVWKKFDPAVYDLLQEQGFTVLNRLCALRMAEDRQLVFPCVSKGLQSDGFQLYEFHTGKSGDANTAEIRYQQFLFSLFDELALDLGSVFDRFSPQGILFPAPRALGELLSQLNDAELSSLWSQDETIGWIYQYWNSKEERKAMRDASSAPRNSRELAVRNQFFTPRYVVEFLTDNTLGRIWYEMCQGQTRLEEQCRYLVRRPTEIFLAKGQEAPEEKAEGGGRKAEENLAQGEEGSRRKAEGREENLSQEELLKQPVEIPYRTLKDPRDIRLLDPACGSMHFGLYAFDLFESIYAEAWDMQVAALEGGGQTAEGRLYGTERTQLSGSVGVAGGHESGGSDLPSHEELSEGRNLRADKPDQESGGIGPVEHRRRTGAEQHSGVSELSGHRPRVVEGGGDPSDDRTETGLPESGNGGGTPCPRREDGTFDPGPAQQILVDLGWSTYGEATSAFCPLPSAFPSQEAFLKAVPAMIIEHNIHGVDIDPRAVQIAGLSLWLRAQKTWKDTPAAERPRVRRSNIVCAEPMPGSDAMLEDFVQTLDPPLLGELVKTVFDKMQLAGEAGSLLKIEQEIRTAIDVARQAWGKLQRQSPELFSTDELNKTLRPGAQQELSGLDESLLALRSLGKAGTGDFFDTAEERIYAALRDYAESAESGDYQRRLFAEDAAHGFAFIDLCRKRYDAVVMNPPFGSFSKLWATQSKIEYPNSSNDILGAFVDRFIHRLHGSGRLGAITSRTCFFLSSFKRWRKNVVLKDSAVRVIADLGKGVMDDAMVEAAAYVLESTKSTSSMPVFRGIADADRQAALEACLDAHNAARTESRLFLADQATFELLEDAPFVYWIDEKTILQFNTGTYMDPDVAAVRQGLSTSDNFRFVRAVWEVCPEDTVFCYYPSNGESFCRLDDPNVKAYVKRRHRGTPQWAFYVMAGSSQPWYAPITVKVKFSDNGWELRNFRDSKGRPKGVLRNTKFYHRPGFSWTLRAVRFYPYLIPGNCIPSASRYMAFPDHGREAEALGVCASRLVSAFLRFYGEKFEFPKFLVATLKQLPWPKIPKEAKSHFETLIRTEVEKRRLAYQNHEPFHEFLIPGKIRDFSDGGKSLGFEAESLLDDETEKIVADAFGFTKEQAHAVERDLLEAISYQQEGGAGGEDENAESDEEADSDFVLDYSKPAREEATLSYLLGTTLGRWDIRYSTGERQPPELPDPFDPLPVCPPGMLQNADGLSAAPAEVPDDYPLLITWPGILVDDDGHSEDIVARVREAFTVIWGDRSSAIEQEACEILGVRTLREYFAEKKFGGIFFKKHLKRYSKSRRQAPIYWPLSTESGNYTLWIYYHRLNENTLYSVVTQFIEPKQEEAQKTFNRLNAQKTRIKQEDKDLENAQLLIAELATFRESLLEIAKFWKPNLNDGVQITAAPLWKHFRLPAWQNKLKETWKKLEFGEYDWAYLAHSIWPERVIPKCAKDHSLAIAHGHEAELWEEITDSKGKTKWQPISNATQIANDLVKKGGEN